MEAVIISLPLYLLYVPPYSIVPVNLSAIYCGVMAHEYLKRLVKEFNKAIEEACRKTLKLKHASDVRGAAW